MKHSRQLKVSAAEYKDFQAFKQMHADWQALLKAK